MSPAPTAAGHAGHAGHVGHDDHAFTGEPVQVLPPDEPRTPGWLTLLGGALFTVLAVFILVTHGGPAATTPAAEPEPPPVAAQGGTPVAAPSGMRVAAPGGVRADARGAPPAGAPAGGQPAAAPQLSPEQIQALRKRVDEAKAKGLLPDGKRPK
jgi:hypothetical protein